MKNDEKETAMENGLGVTKEAEPLPLELEQKQLLVPVESKDELFARETAKSPANEGKKGVEAEASGHKVESQQKTGEPHAQTQETAIDGGEVVGSDSPDASPSDDIRSHIMPIPVVTRNAGPMDSLPGAYHAGGTSFSVDNSADTPAASQELVVDPCMDHGGLAVAQMVADENHHDPTQLPQAIEDVPNESMRREQKAKEFKTMILLGVIILIAIVAIVVGFVVPSKEKQTEIPSVAPTTIAPTSYEQVIRGNVLALFPPETVNATEVPDSPQSKALQWLVEDENLPFLSDDRIKQRFALATLYFATNGQEWSNNENWLDHNMHECDWYNSDEFGMKSFFSIAIPGYLTEYPPPGPPATTCHNVTGMYQNLWLSSNLVGTLPLEFYWLTSLQTLTFGIHTLEGSISSHLGQLTNLQGLIFPKMRSEEGFEPMGPIPSEIGLLTSMSIMIIPGNSFEGPIPTELWQLTNLSTMIMSRNPTLKDTLLTSEIGNLQNLRMLILNGCELSGTLPTELGLLDTLEYAGLYENNMKGTIPTEIAGMTSLTLLSLYTNSLTGTTPSEIGLMTSLTSLSLFNNSLTGTPPSELGLLTDLKFVSISGNQLTGSIPSEYGQLTMVGQLSLANNSLSGAIPQELSMLQQSLQSLHLEGNAMLSGIFPEALCSLDGSCDTDSLTACEPTFGLFFDCTSSLCGCNCSCDAEK